jgi:hypothetical protein
MRSSVDCTTNTSEPEFSVHTGLQIAIVWIEQVDLEAAASVHLSKSAKYIQANLSQSYLVGHIGRLSLASSLNPHPWQLPAPGEQEAPRPLRERQCIGSLTGASAHFRFLTRAPVPYPFCSIKSTSSAHKPANRGLLVRDDEPSVRRGMRGGPDMRGLKLRARHAVTVEPVSGSEQVGDRLRGRHLGARQDILMAVSLKLPPITAPAWRRSSSRLRRPRPSP